ncbi:hypothetical protein [Deinococcus soli (ex Cha et al. 2016)]|uniref:Uncharacterized protein n=2 Tax=Deinococcus soli (ex Cha et al. 2016) TaxID=1309411 RepID=A0AAE4BQ23_9DEIO|nr:hypothetical protein [Deinococcus soli (ex Cha et al. 2016)]MDR6220804.1 hypothetical protein [Deinococcus soli (ex Cha et al. 2016)]MDR6330796.1 hypothetical protein [Deinococcus soli (ex Cha et al. 2016)]MDR6753903.1 hypothetical protein [Deinococcus soli (ex Cha et al. 2016)]
MTDSSSLALFGLLAFMLLLHALGVKLPFAQVFAFLSGSARQLTALAAFTALLTYLLKL